MEDRFRYDGKRVLVVGCYSGMGAAAAKVVVVARRRGAWCRLPGSRLRARRPSPHATLRDCARPSTTSSHPLGTHRPALLLRGAPADTPRTGGLRGATSPRCAGVVGRRARLTCRRAALSPSSRRTPGCGFVERMPLHHGVCCGTDGYDGAPRLGGHAPRSARRRATRCRRRRSSVYTMKTRHRCRRGRRPRELHQPGTDRDADDAGVREGRRRRVHRQVQTGRWIAKPSPRSRRGPWRS